MSNFNYIKLPLDTEAIISNKPVLVMSEDQLEGKDIEGAHEVVMKWLNALLKDIEQSKKGDCK